MDSHKKLTKKKPEELSEVLKKDYAEFIELTAHDLQAPLRKLSVLIERLTDKYKEIISGDGQEYLTRIEKCLNDMQSLIDDLSQLAGISAAPVNYTLCDIREIIEEVAEELKPQVNEKKAVITLSFLPVIKADRMQCKQLFKNLLENSIRFSKKNIPPLIKVSSQQLTGEEKKSLGLRETKSYYKIVVSDNGVGFNQENAQKIFQPLARLHGKSEYPGNGVGLAICKKITDNHNGIIYAEGFENSFARFIIVLPQTS